MPTLFGYNEIFGTPDGDFLPGTPKNDSFDAGEGADTMIGGKGNDLYEVDDPGYIIIHNSNPTGGLSPSGSISVDMPRIEFVPGDQVIEKPGEGQDKVWAYCSYALPENVEDLRLMELPNPGSQPENASNLNGFGNNLDNNIEGNGEDNTLMGREGNDLLDGTYGTDTLIGGTGDDSYILYDAHAVKTEGSGFQSHVVIYQDDKVIEKPGEGHDSIMVYDSYVLPDNIEDLALNGNAVFGTGNGLNNLVEGTLKNNTLYGMAGNDTLWGNEGADELYGGTGKDTFLFQTLKDSTVAGSGRDSIMDFRQAQHDRIDLHLIDANTKTAGNQAFHFIGDDAFGRHAGELQALSTKGGDTLVRGDVDGNGHVDFAIVLHGHVALHASDFVL